MSHGDPGLSFMFRFEWKALRVFGLRVGLNPLEPLHDGLVRTGLSSGVEAGHDSDTGRDYLLGAMLIPSAREIRIPIGETMHATLSAARDVEGAQTLLIGLPELFGTTVVPLLAQAGGHVRVYRGVDEGSLLTLEVPLKAGQRIGYTGERSTAWFLLDPEGGQ